MKAARIVLAITMLSGWALSLGCGSGADHELEHEVVEISYQVSRLVESHFMETGVVPRDWATLRRHYGPPVDKLLHPGMSVSWIVREAGQRRVSPVSVSVFLGGELLDRSRWELYLVPQSEANYVRYRMDPATLERSVIPDRQNLAYALADRVWRNVLPVSTGQEVALSRLRSDRDETMPEFAFHEDEYRASISDGVRWIIIDDLVESRRYKFVIGGIETLGPPVVTPIP